jgi:hypothetical protein
LVWRRCCCGYAVMRWRAADAAVGAAVAGAAAEAVVAAGSRAAGVVCRAVAAVSPAVAAVVGIGAGIAAATVVVESVAPRRCRGHRVVRRRSTARVVAAAMPALGPAMAICPPQEDGPAQVAGRAAVVLLVHGQVSVLVLVLGRVLASARDREAFRRVGICKTFSTFPAAAMPARVGHPLAR